MRNESPVVGFVRDLTEQDGELPDLAAPDVHSLFPSQHRGPSKPRRANLHEWYCQRTGDSSLSQPANRRSSKGQRGEGQPSGTRLQAGETLDRVLG